jgi:hypothetical protein
VSDSLRFFDLDAERTKIRRWRLHRKSLGDRIKRAEERIAKHRARVKAAALREEVG